MEVERRKGRVINVKFILSNGSISFFRFGSILTVERRDQRGQLKTAKEFRLLPELYKEIWKKARGIFWQDIRSLQEPDIVQMPSPRLPFWYVEEAYALNKKFKSLKTGTMKKAELIIRDLLPHNPLDQDTLYRKLRSESYRLAVLLWKVNIEFTEAGSPIVCFWKRTNLPTRRKVVLTDINSAIRQQEHIADEYVGKHPSAIGELNLIESQMDLLKNANVLLVQWKKLKSTDKNLIVTLISKLVEQLSLARDKRKREAKSQAEHIATLTDRLGRSNPGALAARSIAAIGRLSERSSLIFDTILPHAILRYELLCLAKQDNIGILQEALNNISHFLSLQRSLHVVSPHQLKRQLRGDVLRLLMQAYASPFKDAATQSVFYVEAASDCIESSKYTEGIMYLEKASNVLSSILGSP